MLREGATSSVANTKPPSPRDKRERLKLWKKSKQFQRDLAAKLAEDDRVEQLSAQKRRMKLLEHSREVRRLAEEKFAAREARLELERRELDASRREREAMDAAIEREREKLLAEFHNKTASLA